jgi:pilus assembly protein CpaD
MACSFTSRPTLATLLLLVVPLAGCTTDRVVPSNVALDDYRARHPIVIAQARTSIDIFPSMGQGRLDTHSAKQVFAFAEQYRETGQGPVLILVPRGPGVASRQAIVADIRRVLASGGAKSGAQVSTYPIADPALASPVRLSFVGVKAKEVNQCGQWPRDLASGSSIDGWENEPYWNLGCSTQQMIAAQTSDPRDLVSPRGEERPDTEIRDRAITAVRAGTDPNTNWAVKNSSIGSVGGS